jgi:hypothetical protein
LASARKGVRRRARHPDQQARDDCGSPCHAEAARGSVQRRRVE